VLLMRFLVCVPVWACCPLDTCLLTLADCWPFDRNPLHLCPSLSRAE
jgi:hypothetical protein